MTNGKGSMPFQGWEFAVNRFARQGAAFDAVETAGKRVSSSSGFKSES